jgi:hypothetical protein
LQAISNLFQAHLVTRIFFVCKQPVNLLANIGFYSCGRRAVNYYPNLLKESILIAINNRGTTLIWNPAMPTGVCQAVWERKTYSVAVRNALRSSAS